jgi:VWA domain-containing protein
MEQDRIPQSGSEPTPAQKGPDLNDWGRVLRGWKEKEKPAIPVPGPPPPAPVVETKTIRHASPLTDPRSLGMSLVFHVAVVAIASLAAISVGLPAEHEAEPTVLKGDLGPVDNRAHDTGGGSPGELGGTDTIRLSADGQSPQSQALRDPTADALLSEILPAPASPDASQRALPGPLTTGLGVIPGPGTGGGGGSGGGSGGGIGRGIGPGTEFFGAKEHAVSFAYVIDCSGSMAMFKALEVAKRELLASLNQLPPDARFALVFYNLNSTVFADDRGRPDLMPATVANKNRVRSWLSTVAPDGGTNHMTALRTALTLKPEVVYFLTDADLMDRKDAEQIVAEAGRTRIQSIEFGLGPNLSESAPLRYLSTATGGTYRYIDVTRFGRHNR